MTRAPGWHETVAFARYSLRLEQEEFFRMTPRMLAEIRKLWTAEHRDMQRMVAILRTDLINFSFWRPKEPVKLEDLFPEEGAPRRPRAKTRKQIDTQLRAIFSAMAAKGRGER